MKYLKPMILVLLGVAAGFVAGAVLHERPKLESPETAMLRAALRQAERAARQAVDQRDRLQDRLRAASQDIHRLRAEVSRLSRELTEVQASQEQAARAARKSEAPNKGSVKLKEAPEMGAVPVDSTPAAVQTALFRELGHRPISGVLGSSIDKNGRMTYGFKGQTSDLRGIAVRLAEDGAVLERSIEIAADTVPAHVQAPAAQIFGILPISTAREILDGDSLIYELSAKGPESAMQAMVRDDGTMLGYSAKWRQPEREQSTEKR
jgi:multidrug efflux pump subunit AcrA (membrane-fusion protein)